MKPGRKKDMPTTIWRYREELFEQIGVIKVNGCTDRTYEAKKKTKTVKGKRAVDPCFRSANASSPQRERERKGSGRAHNIWTSRWTEGGEELGKRENNNKKSDRRKRS